MNATTAIGAATGWRAERGYRDESDTALVRRSQGGDQGAFSVLLGRHRPGLRVVCARYLRDPHDQEELLQEVMIKAWRRIGSFDARSALTGWLHRIAANAAIDEYRRRSRAPIPVDPLLETPWHTHESHERAVVDESHLRWALALLPERYRAVSLLADRFGMPLAEIAQLYDIPEATVRTRLQRARRALRASFSPLEAT